MAQVQTGSVASGRLKQPTFLATARSRRSATPALPDAAAASSQPQAQPQVRAPLPTPTIRHPGPRTPIGSPCIPHSLSVHCLCKPCNPGPNAPHPARPASPPTPVAPPAARAPRPAIRAQSHVAVSRRPGPGDRANTRPTAPLPRPTPPAIRRQRPASPPANPLNASPVSRASAGRPSPAPDRPQTPPKHTPRRLKSFLEKTLTAREAPASRPSNNPSVPSPSPGLSAGPMPHAQGTRRPLPVALMGRPALPLAPPTARSFPASEARKSAKKSAQTVSRQPVPRGDGLARDGSPLHPHAAPAHTHPAEPCTLTSRSTVTLESRS